MTVASSLGIRRLYDRNQPSHCFRYSAASNHLHANGNQPESDGGMRSPTDPRRASIVQGWRIPEKRASPPNGARRLRIRRDQTAQAAARVVRAAGRIGFGRLKAGSHRWCRCRQCCRRAGQGRAGFGRPEAGSRRWSRYLRVAMALQAGDLPYIDAGRSSDPVDRPQFPRGPV